MHQKDIKREWEGEEEVFVFDLTIKSDTSVISSGIGEQTSTEERKLVS